MTILTIVSIMRSTRDSAAPMKFGAVGGRRAVTMRIALDARTIYRPMRRGTAKNLVDLYGHVARLRPAWRVVAFHRTDGELPPLMPETVCQPKLIEMIGDRVDAWGRWRLPLAAWRAGADLLHCPSNHCPTWLPLPAVVTIHDLIPLDMPQGRDSMQVRRFEQSIRSACREAVWIICPSRYTRDRLVDDFDADRNRITVNHWAPDGALRLVPQDKWPHVLARYGVRCPFVLHFGAASPRKNTRRLIHAWQEMHQSLRRHWQLLIVGLDPGFAAQLNALVAQMNLTQNVILRGFADEADIPALLSAADVLAYPSLSEGFGLPILDAWKTETPVLASSRTALPEVAGDAALLVDPTSTDAITDGLEQLLEFPLCRAELVQRGRSRVGAFDWQRTAQRFVHAMEQAAALAESRRQTEPLAGTCTIHDHIST